MNLSKRIRTLRMLLDGSAYYHAGGAAAYTSEYIDTAGWSGIRFILTTGLAVNAGSITMQVTGCATYNGSYVALTGALASYTFATATGVVGKTFIVEINKPRTRFLKVVTTTIDQTCVLQGLVVELFAPNGSIPNDAAHVPATNLSITPVIVVNV